MLINEIAQKTGISKKAIYIYESKGLLKVQRRANRYREYTAEDGRRLNKIKLLRLAGISIADIKLLFDNIVTIYALLQRKNQFHNNRRRNKPKPNAYFKQSRSFPETD